MKSIKKIIIFIFAFILWTNNVSATSLSIKSSASSITKGRSITITSLISADSGIYTTTGTVKCTGAGVNSSVDLSYEDLNTANKSKSFSLTIKPTTSGTITCSSSNVRIRELAQEKEYQLSDKSISITVKEPAVIPPKEYSKNNYLKSLSVEGYDISFDKDTLEYSIEVGNEVEKVKINAQTEDSKASVSGIGEREVSEGNNKLEVRVEAENGNVKTYVINVIVKELDPINVKIGSEEYTVIRKEDVLTVLPNYQKTTVNINGEDVLAYYNEITKFTIVGLKDSKGVANYYIYDDGEYTLYKEYTFNGITLYLTGKDVNIDNYDETTFNYNNDKLNAYKLSDNSLIKKTYALDVDELKNYYLFYAINVNTGEENLYKYDPLEGTVQRYDSSIIDLLDVYKENADRNFILFIIASALLVLIAIIKLIMIIINKNKDKSLKIKKNNVKEIDL